MKFWELVGVVGRYKDCMREVLNKNEIYAECIYWYDCYKGDNNTSLPHKRNVVIPDELILEILSRHPGILYQAPDNLRSYKFNDNDADVTYLNAYKKYGGEILADVIEKGSMARQDRKKFF